MSKTTDDEGEPRGASQGRALAIGMRLLVALAAGILFAVSFPPYGMPVLLPFGFALLLNALDGARPKLGAYLGLACGVVYFGATLFWLHNLFGAAAVSLIAIAAAFPLLFGLAFTFLRKRSPGIPIRLLAPVLWTGIEYYRSEPFPLNFGWMGFGYATVNTLWRQCWPRGSAATALNL